MIFPDFKQARHGQIGVGFQQQERNGQIGTGIVNIEDDGNNWDLSNFDDVCEHHRCELFGW